MNTYCYYLSSVTVHLSSIIFWMLIDEIEKFGNMSNPFLYISLAKVNILSCVMAGWGSRSNPYQDPGNIPGVSFY